MITPGLPTILVIGSDKFFCNTYRGQQNNRKQTILTEISSPAPTAGSVASFFTVGQGLKLSLSIQLSELRVSESMSVTLHVL